MFTLQANLDFGVVLHRYLAESIKHPEHAARVPVVATGDVPAIEQFIVLTQELLVTRILPYSAAVYFLHRAAWALALIVAEQREDSQALRAKIEREIKAVGGDPDDWAGLTAPPVAVANAINQYIKICGQELSSAIQRFHLKAIDDLLADMPQYSAIYKEGADIVGDHGGEDATTSLHPIFDGYFAVSHDRRGLADERATHARIVHMLDTVESTEVYVGNKSGQPVFGVRLSLIDEESGFHASLPVEVSAALQDLLAAVPTHHSDSNYRELVMSLREQIRDLHGQIEQAAALLGVNESSILAPVKAQNSTRSWARQMLSMAADASTSNSPMRLTLPNGTGMTLERVEMDIGQQSIVFHGIRDESREGVRMSVKIGQSELPSVSVDQDGAIHTLH